MNTQEEWQKAISELENALNELAQKQLMLAHAEQQSLPVKRQNLSELERSNHIRSQDIDPNKANGLSNGQLTGDYFACKEHIRLNVNKSPECSYIHKKIEDREPNQQCLPKTLLMNEQTTRVVYCLDRGEEITEKITSDEKNNTIHTQFNRGINVATDYSY